MCGICGKLDFIGSPVDENLLRRMTDALTHRGPDDSDVYLRQQGNVSCGLGHRRLSIIDLTEAGRQPMTNEDRTIWMVFNGEIYNFAALREELEKKGHRFASRTDSEVIIHLFEEEGSAGIARLVGMFALALWSEKTQTLVLARDHVGIKPLVYYWDGKIFLFASEIKSLLADPAVRKEMDLEALDLYLSLNYIPAPHTIFKNIRKLRPGHILTVRDGVLKEEEFWDIAPVIPANASDHRDFEETKATLFRTLEDAVRSQMVADVPLGAFLSGGIDSSVIVGLMARNASRPVKTYAIGFADMPMYDESAYAREVAAFHHTEHHEIMLSSREIIDTIPAVLASFDEPFGDSSAVPTYVVARETVRDVTVALSGDGGDELFAGYRMYKGEAWHRRYCLIPRLLRSKLLEPAIRSLPDSRDNKYGEQIRRMKKFLRGAKETFPERIFSWNELFSRESKKDLLTDSYGTDHPLAPELLAAALNRMPTDYINRMLYTDLKISLPADMLWKVDMMSMRHSLEVRVPLLDHRVCELAFTIGGEWKIRHGQSKYVFIETFKDILPKSLHNRPKWGFEMPISKWLKSDLRYLIEENLSQERISREGIFHYPAVKKLIDNLMSNRSDTSWQIWNLIVFQVWYSHYGKN
ncbi:MAG: asparagine synthase (glutamine-hydrolyzing) [Deltaproteobacteria bacterium]|nr:asparagine synthase (glutamine-hydrolyzing) [Deltaproteobacteria bacterium]